MPFRYPQEIEKTTKKKDLNSRIDIQQVFNNNINLFFVG